MRLAIENLKKAYVAPDGQALPIIDIESLAIDAGTHVGLHGPSGSGKTTLLHLIGGILVPDSGRIIFDFRSHAPASRPGSEPPPGAEALVDIAALSEPQRDVFRGRHIGCIFQQHHLLPGFTALENVLLGMSFTGRKHDVQWARHLLSEVGLAERLDYRPDKLSLGQQQRVAVARAMANRPKLVLADEPTGSLDAASAQQVLDLIRRLCSEVGATLLLVSHDMSIINQLPVVLRLSDINRAGK